MPERSQMMTDWEGYERRHGQRCIIEDPWAGPVDWRGAPPAEDWFFLLCLGHSGSCVLSEMLSLHPEVYCANEDQTILALLGLLTTRTVMSLGSTALHWQSGLWSGRDKPFTCETRVVTAPFLRDLAEVWREHYGRGKAFCGDKHTWYLRHRAELRRIFPGCKLLYTVRHPLDQLSGLMSDEWVGNRAIADDPKGAWGQIGCYVRMYREVVCEPDVFIVPYEAFAEPATLAETMCGCYRRVGASPDDVSEEQLAGFASRKSVERWRLDSSVLALLDQWRESRLMTEEQEGALTSSPGEYLRAITGAEW